VKTLPKGFLPMAVGAGVFVFKKNLDDFTSEKRTKEWTK
jgi:hypothetical protein